MFVLTECAGRGGNLPAADMGIGLDPGLRARSPIGGCGRNELCPYWTTTPVKRAGEMGARLQPRYGLARGIT